MAGAAMGQNVKTYSTMQCLFLLSLKIGVPLFICIIRMQFTEFCETILVIWFTDIGVYLGMLTEL